MFQIGQVARAARAPSETPMTQLLCSYKDSRQHFLDFYAHLAGPGSDKTNKKKKRRRCHTDR